MMDDWRSLFQQKVDWIVIETWNDYVGGSAVGADPLLRRARTGPDHGGHPAVPTERGPVTQALRVQAPTIVPPRSGRAGRDSCSKRLVETWKRGRYQRVRPRGIRRTNWWSRVRASQPSNGVADGDPGPHPSGGRHAKQQRASAVPGHYEIRIDLARLTRDADGKAVETVFPDPVAVFR